MGAETPGDGAPRPPRPTGKRLPERRQGFLIYLPRGVHAKLKAEAARRVITMSELVLTAIAQFLSVQEPSVPVPPSRGPFVGEYGQTRPFQVAPPPAASEALMAAEGEPETFEVED